MWRADHYHKGMEIMVIAIIQILLFKLRFALYTYLYSFLHFSFPQQRYIYLRMER